MLKATPADEAIARCERGAYQYAFLNILSAIKPKSCVLSAALRLYIDPHLPYKPDMNFMRSFGITDIADMAIVAVFIYAGLLWFKRTRAFLVVLGIVILGIVYATARYLNLFLTTAMLQGFFAVLLIAIIVIFQEEIRQFFERVALWGLGRHRKQEAVPLVAAIAGTATDLARARVGALIAIAGRDHLGRHIEGGTALDGIPSESLFKSIFDKNSPGHDGAVIIEGGRVVRFGVHLPLSKDLSKLSGVGTRHAAALGLAERCDALCIVVSEERGAISCARDGELSPIKDSKALGPILDDFLREKFPPEADKQRVKFLRRNMREKAIAMALSVGLWAAFALKTGIVQRDILVPIEYSNVAEGLSIERSVPHDLMVTLSGEQRDFRFFSADEVKASVDVSGKGEGRQRIPVSSATVSKIPRNLSIDSIRPAEIDLFLKKNSEKEPKDK